MWLGSVDAIMWQTLSGPSSATPQGSQSNSLGFAAKVLDAWTSARPMKCRAMKWHAINCRAMKCRRTLLTNMIVSNVVLSCTFQTRALRHVRPYRRVQTREIAHNFGRIFKFCPSNFFFLGGRSFQKLYQCTHIRPITPALRHVAWKSFMRILPLAPKW